MNIFSLLHSTFEYHTNMVGDSIRVAKYIEAMNQIITIDDVVVEIGSGSGIFSAYATLLSNNKVTGIEYDYKMFELSNKINEPNISLGKLQFINAKSFSVKADNSPTVILAELMGQVGLGENIVECLYDFRKRHKSVKKIIPYKLDIMLQPMQCDFFDTSIEKYLYPWIDRFPNCSRCDLITIIENELSAQIISLNVSFYKCKQQYNPICVKSYKLGEDWDSSFKFELNMKDYPNSNCVHVFFNAHMGNDIVLTTHQSEPLTHWKHSYLYKPIHKNYLLLKYILNSKTIDFEWSRHE